MLRASHLPHRRCAPGVIYTKAIVKKLSGPQNKMFHQDRVLRPAAEHQPQFENKDVIPGQSS